MKGFLRSKLVLSLAAFLMIAAAIVIPLSSSIRHSHAAAPQVLILASSVTSGTATDGSGKSLEQQQAEADGFTVTLATDSQWDAMTASQFAAYQALVIGDPTCQGDESYAAAQTNASVWEPVVMASGGNKVLIGTDATFHNTGPGGTRRGDLLEAKGIAFAGAVAGATGAYVDTSCEFSTSDPGDSAAPPGTAVPIMDGLSTHGPHQFTAGGAPCAGSISIVASSGPTSGLHDADLSNWGCSVHAFFDHFPSDWTVLALATDPTVPQTYSATDVDTGATVSGSPYILLSGGGITVKSNISLTPASATNPVGGSHTVTATVLKGGSPEAGKTVTFSIDSGPNMGAVGTCSPISCATDVNGQVTFTYADSGGVGTDSISATFVDDAGALEKATATKTWVAATDPAIKATGTPVAATEGVSISGAVATITDPDAKATASEYSATIDWGDSSVTTAGTVAGPAGGPFTVSGSHTYAEEGSFTVTATITDVDNVSNGATATSTATVADAALSATGKTLSSTNPVPANTVVTSFTDADPNGTVADYTATVNWGDGSPPSAGTIAASGSGFTVSGGHTYPALGPYTIKVHICDVGGSCADATSSILLFAFSSGGSFVVGDKTVGPISGAVGELVNFWGSQWSKNNSLSAGPAPASFKGFQDSSATPACGVNWSTDPGNSAPPPTTIPSYMAVIVAGKVTQSGAVISGNDLHVVIVKTNAGYASDPGHPGTGTIVAVLC